MRWEASGRSRAEASDAAAFEAMASAWTADLGRLAYLLTGDADAADDLVADALLAAWERRDDVAGARSPKAYVRRIVINQAASRVRRLTRARAKRHLVGVPTDHVGLPDVEGGIELRRALDSLPGGQRECVILRYGMDLSEADVAEILSVSVGTVKSQTSKGAAKLRRLLGSAGLP